MISKQSASPVASLSADCNTIKPDELDPGPARPGPGCAAVVADLRAHGLTALLPLAGKKSVVRWKAGRHPSPGELDVLAELHPEYNLAVHTGTPSGIVVVDVDKLHLLDADGNLPDGNLPPTLTVATGRADQGRHYYYRLPAGTSLPKYKLSSGAGEVQAEGAYVVAAGSVHPDTGTVYMWLDPGMDIAPAPDWLLAGKSSTSSTGSTTGPRTTTTTTTAADRALFVSLWAELGVMAGPGQSSHRCPFHDDSSPSLSVSTDTLGWTCHAGCGAGYLWQLWQRARPTEPYPGPMYRTAEFDELVQGWVAQFWAPWAGRRGPSQQKVYMVLVGKALRLGRPVVGVSDRELAELGNMARDTGKRAMRDLLDAGLVRRVFVGRLRQASQYELVRVGECETRPIDFGCKQTHLHIGGLVSHTPAHDAWAHGALGSAWATSLHLRALGGSTVTDLSAATGRHRTTIRTHLVKLAAAGLVKQESAGLWVWSVVDELDDAHLRAVAQEYGTVGRLQRRKDWHAIERAAQEISLRESHDDYMAEHWYVTDPDTGRQELVTMSRPLVAL